jgi:amine acid ABC transporter, permease protein, 3-TM region, His/Glu/Gln/Arg/opine family
MDFILKSTGITIKITVVSFLLAIVLAVIIGVLRSEKLPKPLELFLHFYIEIFRGSPLLIQLFFIYYGLPSIGITMGSFTAAVLGLALNGGAYMSEIVRAAIMSVDKGQEEAAFSLGMNKLERLFHIILPQAFRIAIPTLVNSFSAILKDTSLVSVLSITELTRSGQLIYTRTSRPFEIYLTLGILYFAMTYIIAFLSKGLEKRMNRMYS